MQGLFHRYEVYGLVRVGEKYLCVVKVYIITILGTILSVNGFTLRNLFFLICFCIEP
jgi:hypothetical protein